MVSARSEAKRNRKSHVPFSRLFFIERDAPSERTERAKARARDEREKEKNASINTPPSSLSLSSHRENKRTKILPSSSTSFSCAASIKLSPTFAFTVISSPVFSVNVTAIVFTSSSSFPSLCSLCSRTTREAVAMDDEEGTTRRVVAPATVLPALVASRF